jgi:hypothetical protein
MTIPALPLSIEQETLAELKKITRLLIEIRDQGPKAKNNGKNK